MLCSEWVSGAVVMSSEKMMGMSTAGRRGICSLVQVGEVFDDEDAATIFIDLQQGGLVIGMSESWYQIFTMSSIKCDT
jgi:hypothetical protein